jgi:DNA-binding LytR/AlgR family response regulator
MDGLAVATALLDLPDAPLVVFATAYDEHALQAFEVAAVDYVVKPFDERRLAGTVERLKRMAADQEQRQINEAALHDFVTRAALPGRFTKLWAERENETRRLVDYADILWLEAREKKVYLGLEEEELRTRYTLKELEARLPTHTFVRVHRGFIVNLDHVVEVVPWFSGTYIIRMNDTDDTEIPMSRRYAASLKKLPGWN